MLSNSVKVDLHVHSASSKDCCTEIEDFRKAFDSGVVDKIAITDHSVIGMAYELKKLFGDRIIIGEEIMSAQGEIIGLFLEREIPKMLSAEETIEEIRKQNGIVYIPHPFDERRSGIGKYVDSVRIMQLADIIEVYNSRCFVDESNEKALEFAEREHMLMAAGSDAHDWKEIGRSHIEMPDFSNRDEFLANLALAYIIKNKMRMRSILSPTSNKIKKSLMRTYEGLSHATRMHHD